MNPCPCGYLGHFSGKCRCTPDQVARYRGKISGPLLDRIDIQIEVPAPPEEDLMRQAQGESSETIRSACKPLISGNWNARGRRMPIWQ